MPFGQVLHLNALSFSLCLYRLHSEKSNQTKILFFERKIFKPPKPYILISIIVYVGPIFATGIKKIPVTFRHLTEGRGQPRLERSGSFKEKF